MDTVQRNQLGHELNIAVQESILGSEKGKQPGVSWTLKEGSARCGGRGRE